MLAMEAARRRLPAATSAAMPDAAALRVTHAFLVVNFFGFLVITRNHTMRFGPKLEEIFL